MSRGINRVTLLGNLGNDVELKYSQGGTAIATLSVATTERRKDKDGAVQEKTSWHRCKAFGKTAEIAAEYLKKGSQVHIDGRIDYSTSGEGDAKKYFTDIIVNDLLLLGGRDGAGSTQAGRGAAPGASRPSGGAPTERAPQRPAQAAPPRPAAAPVDDFSDSVDDIPW